MSNGRRSIPSMARGTRSSGKVSERPDFIRANGILLSRDSTASCIMRVKVRTPWLGSSRLCWLQRGGRRL